MYFGDGGNAKCMNSPSKGNAMIRTGLISIFLFLLPAGAAVLATQQDYIDELMKLSQLTDDEQYREAINGYKRLESQPGRPRGSRRDPSMR